MTGNSRKVGNDAVDIAKALGKAADELYGKTDFLNEKERMEFLFDIYAKITEPLID